MTLSLFRVAIEAGLGLPGQGLEIGK
jgi:hypothetical protein